MNNSIILSRVAVGLNKMSSPPDYLLFNDGSGLDWTWDEDTICGIDVLHINITPWSAYGGEICPFIPAWFGEHAKEHDMDTQKFSRGYYEEC